MTNDLPPYQLLTAAQIAELTEVVFGPGTAPVQSDLGFVFGGTHPGLWETAMAAWRRKLVSRFVITGGAVPHRAHSMHPDWPYSLVIPESVGIAAQLRARGVPREAIVTEERSTNSLENVLLGLELVDLSDVKRVLVIAKSYGAGRQVRTLRRHLPAPIEISVMSFATAVPRQGLPPIDRGNWMEYEKGVRLVLAAYERIVRYGAAGDLVPAEPVRGVTV